MAAIAAAALLPAAVCPDALQHNVDLGGTGPTAVANATDAAVCCAMCHGDYHDECVAWSFGDGKCVIMPYLPKARAAPGFVSAQYTQPKTPAPAAGGTPCRADFDCDVHAQTGWRCEKDAAAVGGKAECHLPGPGTKGNATCACATLKCAQGPAAPANASSLQYLMIGDSISMGMRADVSGIVSAKGWELTHNPGNADSTNVGYHCADAWIRADAREWDVISYNFGLHDLAYDTERLNVDQYSSLLKDITAKLVAQQKRSGAKLLWVTTTPVPTVPTYGPGCNDTRVCLNPPRYDSDVVEFNAAAAKVVAAANAGGAKIATLDLYSFVLEHCGGHGYSNCTGFQLPSNVHYTSQGWAALANQTAAALLAL